MAPGVAPREASDRLIIFQNTFDTLFRKYVTYTGKQMHCYYMYFYDVAMYLYVFDLKDV